MYGKTKIIFKERIYEITVYNRKRRRGENDGRAGADENNGSALVS